MARGRVANYTGFGVCFSGATSQGSCGWVVDNHFDMVFCAVTVNGSRTGWSTNPAWVAHSIGSRTIACHGDSGGIVCRGAPGGFSVLGSLSGVSIADGVMCGSQSMWSTSWGDMTQRLPGFLPKIN